MLMPRTAWGLDVGEASVKAVKMRRTRGGVDILAFDAIERKLPSSGSGDKDYELRAAVAALAERNRFGRTPVVVSIPEPAFSRFIPLPPVDKRRIPEVVRYEARQQIPFPIEEVVWDYQPVREAYEPGEETEVAIFSLRSQFVYGLLSNLALCRIHPVAVLPVPLALYNYVTFDRDIAKGTIAVDLGAGSTDILICDPDNFRVRNITVSGNGITRALAERLKISHEEAEALKRECRDGTQATRFLKLIQPTLNDLVGQVQRTIGFFKSQIHNVRIEQALLLGETFKLPGVADFFVNQLGCDPMPANVLDRIALSPAVDSRALKEVLPSLSVALGLALQGIELGRVQVNLMPRQVLFRQELRRKRPAAAVAVACLAVMLGTHLISLTVQKGRVAKAKAEQVEITALNKEFAEVDEDYRVAAGEVTTAARALSRSTELSRGYRGCLDATNALNRILHNMSEDIVVSEVRMTRVNVSFEAEEHGGKGGGKKTLPAMRIRLDGHTHRKPLFVERELVTPLRTTPVDANGGRRPLFARVKFDPIRTRAGADGGETYTFSVDCDYLIVD